MSLATFYCIHCVSQNVCLTVSDLSQEKKLIEKPEE